MVGAASRELVEVMAPLVRWIGEEGTKASPDENRAARASVKCGEADHDSIVLSSAKLLRCDYIMISCDNTSNILLLEGDGDDDDARNGNKFNGNARTCTDD
eukprot:CAMPEP_0181092732 /NCGR_PEP_ID=MMETSP1071-20121207/9071_1 /TAXON_ID=35127 /ORGANISM="Thalassiosira sp., Strain NH16" /LENGTH=100 /DNA_ID=CAMNT_0023174923 /DNA_START=561 /DNA_END=859 /DNA_ORIENTATION=-